MGIIRGRSIQGEVVSKRSGYPDRDIEMVLTDSPSPDERID